jgi:hypothetical protein
LTELTSTITNQITLLAAKYSIEESVLKEFAQLVLSSKSTSTKKAKAQSKSKELTLADIKTSVYSHFSVKT